MHVPVLLDMAGCRPPVTSEGWLWLWKWSLCSVFLSEQCWPLHRAGLSAEGSQHCRAVTDLCVEVQSVRRSCKQIALTSVSSHCFCSACGGAPTTSTSHRNFNSILSDSSAAPGISSFSWKMRRVDNTLSKGLSRIKTFAGSSLTVSTKDLSSPVLNRTNQQIILGVEEDVINPGFVSVATTVRMSLN